MEGYSSLLGHAAMASFILLFSTNIISTSANQPSTSTNTHYIQTSCSKTTYPKLCYSSLSSYAPQIQNNPKMLAHVALNVTLRATKSASELMKNISKLHSLKPKEASAMADCVEEIGQAVDELKMSISEMGRDISSSNSDQLINDIQTWVSAALTDDTTCMDGFAGSGMDGEAKYRVKKNMTKVAHLTSIALALINNLVSSSRRGNSALVL